MGNIVFLFEQQRHADHEFNRMLHDMHYQIVEARKIPRPYIKLTSGSTIYFIGGRDPQRLIGMEYDAIFHGSLDDYFAQLIAQRVRQTPEQKRRSKWSLFLTKIQKKITSLILKMRQMLTG